jgi:hypothetical protein
MQGKDYERTQRTPLFICQILGFCFVFFGLQTVQNDMEQLECATWLKMVDIDLFTIQCT